MDQSGPARIRGDRSPELERSNSILSLIQRSGMVSPPPLSPKNDVFVGTGDPFESIRFPSMYYPKLFSSCFLSFVFPHSPEMVSIQVLLACSCDEKYLASLCNSLVPSSPPPGLRPPGIYRIEGIKKKNSRTCESAKVSALTFGIPPHESQGGRAHSTSISMRWTNVSV